MFAQRNQCLSLCDIYFFSIAPIKNKFFYNCDLHNQSYVYNMWHSTSWVIILDNPASLLENHNTLLLQHQCFNDICAIVSQRQKANLFHIKSYWNAMLNSPLHFTLCDNDNKSVPSKLRPFVCVNKRHCGNCLSTLQDYHMGHIFFTCSYVEFNHITFIVDWANTRIIALA